MQEATKDSWERERLLEALEAFQQGTGEAPLLRKWSESTPDAGNPKTDGQRQPMAFVLSTDDVDRHGDVISAMDGDLIHTAATRSFFGPTIMPARLSAAPLIPGWNRTG